MKMQVNSRVCIVILLSFLLIPMQAFAALGVSDGAGHQEGVANSIGRGGSGYTWVGDSWSRAGGYASNAPTLGSESVGNVTFDADTWWSGSGSAGRLIAGGVCSFMASDTAVGIYKAGALAVGTWYATTFDIASYTAGQFGIIAPSGGNTYTATGTKSQVIRSDNTTLSIGIRSGPGTGSIDNVSLKPLSLPSLFSSIQHSTPDVLAETKIHALTTGTQAGLVLNLDSASNPANFMIAYHDGANVKLEKCVAGTYSTLINTATAFSADKVLRVIKDGQSVSVYYNDALIGTTQTVADAGIVNNLNHGLFSTYSGNQLDDFVVYARGTQGQYNILNKWSR